jgi:hypothetical protein
MVGRRRETARFDMRINVNEEKGWKMKILAFRFTAILVVTTFTVLVAQTTQARAKKIRGKDNIQSEFNICRAQLDTEEIHGDKGLCCSKKWGYCIECDTDGNYCVKSTYLIRNPTPNVPTPVDEVLAPTPDEPKIFRPMLRLQTPVDEVLAPTPDEAKPFRPVFRLQQQSAPVAR